jgi:thioredoxin-like negative regulator of GroEL
MITRRLVVIGSAVFAFAMADPASAGETAFTPEAFESAQKADKPILVEVHAVWCTTCKAQIPILSKLTTEPKFKDMVVLRVDFDDQKDIVKKFGVQMQSTLIVYKGYQEVGRSVGDTRASSIEALLDKAI